MNVQQSGHKVLRSLIAVLFITASGSFSHADTIFYDDFTDGSLTDGAPVSWGIVSGDDFRRIEGDDMVFGDDDTNGTGNYAGVFVTLYSAPDVTPISIRTQFSMRSGEWVSLGTRYVAYLGEDGLFGIGDAVDSIDLGQTTTDFQIENEDVVVQLDLIGDRISAWAWRPNETMPDDPLVTATTIRIPSNWFALELGSGVLPTEPLEAVFRYVHVADAHIPEPSTVVLSYVVLLLLFTLRRKDINISRY